MLEENDLTTINQEAKIHHYNKMSCLVVRLQLSLICSFSSKLVYVDVLKHVLQSVETQEWHKDVYDIKV